MTALKIIKTFKENLQKEFPKLIPRLDQGEFVLDQKGDYSVEAVKATWNLYTRLELILSPGVWRRYIGWSPGAIVNGDKQFIFAQLEFLNQQSWVVEVRDKTSLKLAELTKSFLEELLAEQNIFSDYATTISAVSKVYPKAGNIKDNTKKIISEMKDVLMVQIKLYDLSNIPDETLSKATKWIRFIDTAILAEDMGGVKKYSEAAERMKSEFSAKKIWLETLVNHTKNKNTELAMGNIESILQACNSAVQYAKPHLSIPTAKSSSIVITIAQPSPESKENGIVGAIDGILNDLSAEDFYVELEDFSIQLHEFKKNAYALAKFYDADYRGLIGKLTDKVKLQLIDFDYLKEFFRRLDALKRVLNEKNMMDVVVVGILNALEITFTELNNYHVVENLKKLCVKHKEELKREIVADFKKLPKNVNQDHLKDGNEVDFENVMNIFIKPLVYKPGPVGKESWVILGRLEANGKAYQATEELEQHLKSSAEQNGTEISDATKLARFKKGMMIVEKEKYFSPENSSEGFEFVKAARREIGMPAPLLPAPSQSEPLTVVRNTRNKVSNNQSTGWWSRFKRSHSWVNDVLGGVCCVLGVAGIASGLFAMPGAILLATGASMLIGRPLSENVSPQFEVAAAPVPASSFTHTPGLSRPELTVKDAKRLEADVKSLHSAVVGSAENSGFNPKLKTTINVHILDVVPKPLRNNLDLTTDSHSSTPHL